MWPISRSFSHNLFYVVASRFPRDPIFLPSFRPFLRLSISSSVSFFHFLGYSLPPPLILILFPPSPLPPSPNSLFYFPFSVKCTARHFFRVSEFTPLTLYPPSFYLFMHSPLFLSTSVSRTFSPPFPNFIRLHMVPPVEFLADPRDFLSTPLFSNAFPTNRNFWNFVV